MTVKADMPSGEDVARKGRILVADDEETFLKSTADLLRLRGYDCDCAPDAPQAAELLRRRRYDVLICDIKMPGNLELELVRQVQQIARGMPVILITGYPSLQSAVEAIELPVSAYLVKPCNFDELLSKIQRCLAGSKTFPKADDS